MASKLSEIVSQALNTPTTKPKVVNVNTTASPPPNSSSYKFGWLENCASDAEALSGEGYNATEVIRYLLGLSAVDRQDAYARSNATLAGVCLQQAIPNDFKRLAASMVVYFNSDRVLFPTMDRVMAGHGNKRVALALLRRMTVKHTSAKLEKKYPGCTDAVLTTLFGPGGITNKSVGAGLTDLDAVRTSVLATMNARSLTLREKQCLLRLDILNVGQITLEEHAEWLATADPGSLSLQYHLEHMHEMLKSDRDAEILNDLVLNNKDRFVQILLQDEEPEDSAFIDMLPWPTVGENTKRCDALLYLLDTPNRTMLQICLDIWADNNVLPTTESTITWLSQHPTYIGATLVDPDCQKLRQTAIWDKKFETYYELRNDWIRHESLVEKWLENYQTTSVSQLVWLLESGDSNYVHWLCGDYTANQPTAELIGKLCAAGRMWLSIYDLDSLVRAGEPYISMYAEHSKIATGLPNFIVSHSDASPVLTEAVAKDLKEAFASNDSLWELADEEYIYYDVSVQEIIERVINKANAA